MDWMLSGNSGNSMIGYHYKPTRSRTDYSKTKSVISEEVACSLIGKKNGMLHSFYGLNNAHYWYVFGCNYTEVLF